MPVYNNLQLMLDDMTAYIRSTGRSILADSDTSYGVTFFIESFETYAAFWRISRANLESQMARTNTGCNLLTHEGRVRLVSVVLLERARQEQQNAVADYRATSNRTPVIKTTYPVVRKSTNKVKTIFERLLDEEVPDLQTTVQSIDKFEEKYRFLSNFYAAEITFQAITYPTVEHAYQACKTNDKAMRKVISELPTPGDAKRYHVRNKTTIRLDWRDININVMRALVQQKFKEPRLRELLLKTEDAELVEGNTWGDQFWGRCKGEGENWLGRILMDERARIRKELGL